MEVFVVLLQFMLLIPALPLWVISLRTSRARRSRHTTLLAAACAIALLDLAGLLFSLAIAAEVSTIDPPIVFLPPLVTLLLCGWVVRRALASFDLRR